MNEPRPSQALPALVSLFIPPFGQLIQGRVIAFFIWFLILFAAAASIVIGIGVILLPLFWFLCVIDAAGYKPRK